MIENIAGSGGVNKVLALAISGQSGSQVTACFAGSRSATLNVKEEGESGRFEAKTVHKS